MIRNLILATALVPMVCMAQEPAPQKAGDVEHMRQSIRKLTAENERLRTRVAALENRLKSQSVRDRLTQEEQRAENLQAQLFSVVEQEANLQTQLDAVSEQLRPENIDHIPVYGSLRPEEVRESTRRQLINQQRRIQGQLQLLQQNRTRLQSSLSVTDMLIQSLRLQVQSLLHPN